MSVLYTNNAKTTLSADLSNSATSLGVASSSGFPSLSGSHYFYATLDDNTNLEVVKVTAVSGTTWTIVRAQDNTTARAYDSGDTVELRLNAALLTDVVNDALASSFTRQEFTGNGSTTAYTLNKTPNSENDLLVFIEGVFQTQSVYSLSGTTLTFSTAPANTRKIIVYHVSASVSGDSLALNTFSGNGSTTAFTMSVDPLYENNTMVFIDGVYQNKSTYATSGTTLTFDTAPANGTSIDVTTHTQQTVNVPVDGSVSTAKVADDAVTLAKMAANSVDSDQYVDASIDTAHIKDAQVTTAKLAADAVTAAKLADNAVVTANIADDQVTTAKIADDQVTLAKLAGLARGKIIYGDSSGNPAALALGSNGQVLKSDGTDIAWATDATVAALTSEQVQDIVGAMFSSNTETGITATYQDGDGTVDLVIGDDTIVSSMLDTNIAIAGTLGVTGNISSTADIVLTKTGTNDAGIKFATANANRYIASDENGVVSIGTGTTLTGGTQYVTIDSGKVGIGETSPLGKLHVKTADSGVSSANANADDLIVENSDYTGISILGENESNIHFGDNEDPDVGRIEYSHSSNHMVFRTNASDRMLINSSGNVGIGTTNPAGTLHVQMTHTSTDVTAANSNETLVLGNAGSGDGVYNAIKFGGNQQDMYIMSFNDNTQADRRLGFFLGSVAGDAVADERLSIRGNGNVGIGITAPNSNLEVFDASGGAGTGVRINCNNGGSDVWDLYSTTAGRLYVKNPNYSGGVYIQHSATSWTSNSDENLKENITSLGTVGDKLKNYRTSYFNWKDDNRETPKRQIGFIAQDWETDFPEVVNKMEGEPLGMQYTETIPILLKYIQELEARIETLEG